MDGSQFSQIVSTFPSRVIVTSRLSPSHRGHMERHAVKYVFREINIPSSEAFRFG